MEMKMFKEAKEFINSQKDGEEEDDFQFGNQQSTEPDREMKKLLIEEAKWKYNNNEYKAAANLYI